MKPVFINRIQDKWLFAFGGLVCFMIILFCLYLYNEARIALAEKHELDFEILVDEHEELIQHNLSFYEELLWGGVGLFAASDEVDRSEWIQYVKHLKVESRYPGINGIGFIEPVERALLDDFLKKSRLDDFPTFQYRRAGDLATDQLMVIKYIEPVDKNMQAVGLDISTEKNRRSAAKKALENDRATITDPIELVQDDRKLAGFLMLLPVYKENKGGVGENFSGWVYAPFKARQFFENLTNKNETQLNYHVRAWNTAKQNWELIYSNVEESSVELAKYRVEKSIEVIDKPWLIEWTSTKSFEESLQNDSLNNILFIGLSLTLMVIVAVFGLILINRQTQKSANFIAESLIESEQRFGEAFNNAPIGMTIVSTEGHFRQANQVLLEMFGYGKDLLNKTFQEITHPDDLESDLVLLRKLVAGEIQTYSMEKRFFRADGEIIWVLLSVSAVWKNKKVQYFVFQLQDITESRKVDQMKSDFVSIASHQLRTPLSSMRWFLGALEREEGLSDKALNIIHKVQEVSDRMAVLIKDLLTVSKLNSGNQRVNIEVFDVVKVLGHCLDKFKEETDLGSCKIKCETVKNGPLWVKSDVSALQEILFNLMDNGVRYCANNDVLLIGIKSDAKYIYLSVSNDYEDDKLDFDNLFTQFYRGAVSQKKRPDGSGLGLYIVKALADNSGIEISAEKKDNKQIKFTLKIVRQSDPDKDVTGK